MSTIFQLKASQLRLYYALKELILSTMRNSLNRTRGSILHPLRSHRHRSWTFDLPPIPSLSHFEIESGLINSANSRLDDFLWSFTRDLLQHGERLLLSSLLWLNYNQRYCIRSWQLKERMKLLVYLQELSQETLQALEMNLKGHERMCLNLRIWNLLKGNEKASAFKHIFLWSSSDF